MPNAVLTADTTPTLDWADVSGATKYHAQISLYPDFRTIAKEDDTLLSSTYTPTVLATNDSKYYWRWRSFVGGAWGVWSEKYSFWLKTTFTGTVTPSSNWIFVALTPLALTDSYISAIYPEHQIVEEAILRAQRRNLVGDMLSERVGVAKAKITLTYEGAFIEAAQRNEILRFYHMAQGFYLCASINNRTEQVEKVWKVIIAEPPEFNMLAPGVEDCYTTTLVMEEV